MVVGRLERMVRLVRNWRPLSGSDQPRFDPSLPPNDEATLRTLIDDCLAIRGGEVAARRRAQAIAVAFSELDADGRRRFFTVLAEHYRHDDAAVEMAVAEYQAADGQPERAVAVQSLRNAVRPGYEPLLRRFVSFEGGLSFLIELREELLAHTRTDPDLQALDLDLRAMLEGWFDAGFLELRQITWNSPAALLEKLIDYEAVHAIESWDDLRGRLGPARRCYAFLHPGMPDDPLIFVEVALERGIPAALGPLLDHAADRSAADEADTAVFYSISNCHRGLAGVSLGDFLIKRVVEQVSAELANVSQFVTLSPMPGFRRWLESIDDGPELPDTPGPVDEHREHLLRLAAEYLARQKRRDRAADPVAHFHLTNGARLERINWGANPVEVGWDRSLGMMVNYLYRLRDIEANHDRYVATGEVTTSDEIKKLLDG